MSKVMLVEDDNNLREIYEARLQAEGYDIVTAKDGEEALVVAKAEQPELVISDVMMPKISGFEMLDILRNTEGLKTVKVIMLTALGQSDDQDRADRLGADRYLVKSQVTLEDIVKVAHDLLDPAGANAAPEVVGATNLSSVAAAPIPAAPVVAEPVANVPVMVTPAPAPAPVAAPVAVAPVPVTEPIATPPQPVAIAPEPIVSAPIVATPVVAAPVAAEPVATPPEPVAAAPVISMPTVPEDDDAQSTAQESATVEEQIENFVDGASSEATAPQPVTPPAQTTQEAADDASDDKVMAEAVDTLIASTIPAPVEPPKPEPVVAPLAAPVPEPVVSAAPVSVAETPPAPVVAVSDPNPVAAPASNPQTPAAPTAEAPTEGGIDEIPEPTVDAASASPTIAHKKIIQPLDTSPKQDINALLAQEEAKEPVAPTQAGIITPTTPTFEPAAVAIPATPAVNTTPAMPAAPAIPVVAPAGDTLLPPAGNTPLVTPTAAPQPLTDPNSIAL